MDENSFTIENAEHLTTDAEQDLVRPAEALAEETADQVAAETAVQTQEETVDAAMDAAQDITEVSDDTAPEEVVVEKIDPFMEQVHLSGVSEPTGEFPRVDAKINDAYESPDSYFGEGTAKDLRPEPEFEDRPGDASLNSDVEVNSAEFTPSVEAEPHQAEPHQAEPRQEQPEPAPKTYHASNEAPHTARQVYSTYDDEPRKASKEPKYVTRRFFVITLILAMIFSGLVGAAGYALANSIFGGTTVDKSINTTNYNLSKATGSVLSLQEVIARNENSVVAILTETVTTDFWAGQYVTQGAGSGVIYREDGYIITNNHVIEGSSSITVTLHDGTEYPATLVATDELTDIAVIKIDATGLQPVTFGDMNKVSVGDAVIAIGNPLGTLSGTATEGIISALEREITIDNKAMTLLQTSASINPGNSGGGLFDQYGNLIGIVVAKSSGSDVEGLGFAIPVDKVESVAKSLVENGYVEGRPMAGITIIDLTDPSEAMKYGVSIVGVYIQSVTGEKAKAAGLQAGDLIYYLDDDKITSSSQLISLIQTHEVGDVVTFTVVRNNEILKYDVELVESTPELQQAANQQMPSGNADDGSQGETDPNQQPGNNGNSNNGGGNIFDWFFGGGN
ncbi:MAG: trypsin-like peptidase domain-containing protein [Firmicutes bacterium]|nr:trypsin-like peptidase domain-containing protein [Bacillota bacterium]